MMQEEVRSRIPPQGRRLVLSGVIHRFAEAFYDFALPLLVLFVTDSPWLMAAAFIVGYVSEIFASPLGGNLAGRIDRRLLLLIVVSLELLVVCILGVLILTDRLNGIAVLLVAAGLDLLIRVYLIADMEYLPRVVPESQVARANGLIQIGASTSQVAAPLVAGALLYVIGVGGVVVASAIMFLTLLLVLARLSPGSRYARLSQDVSDGSSSLTAWLTSAHGSLIRPMRKLRESFPDVYLLVWWKALIDAMIAGPMLFLPYYFMAVRGISELELGIIVASLAIGGLTAGFLFLRYTVSFHVWYAMGGSSILMALSLGSLAWSEGAVGAALACFVLASGLVLGGRAWISHLQTRVPEQILGGVLGASQLLTSLAGIGSCLVFALLAGHGHLPTGFVVSGGLIALAAGAFLLLMRQVSRTR